MTFSFQCPQCGEVHVDMPSFGASAPASYDDVPAGERKRRCQLGSDDCVIDEQFFFVRGSLEIPVVGESESFTWGVWVSLSRSNFDEWIRTFNMAQRSHIGPFFGWLNAVLSPYPDTFNLKTRVHLRNDGMRPLIELEPTDHPLALEQAHGISIARVADIHAQIMHGHKS